MIVKAFLNAPVYLALYSDQGDHGQREPQTFLKLLGPSRRGLFKVCTFCFLLVLPVKIGQTVCASDSLHVMSQVGMAYRLTDISDWPIYRLFFKYRISVSADCKSWFFYLLSTKNQYLPFFLRLPRYAIPSHKGFPSHWCHKGFFPMSHYLWVKSEGFPNYWRALGFIS